MRQHTTQDHTAKLIELGFAPKMRIKGVCTKYGTVNVEHEAYFGVGELIEILGVHLSSIYYIGIEWFVNAEGIARRRAELIDALYNMIVKLKEERVI